MKNLLKRILSSIILLPLVFFSIFFGSYMLIILIFTFFLISCYEWYTMTKKKDLRIYGISFLVFSFYTFYELSLEFTLVCFIISVCVSTDIGGYVFGKTFKGPKLTKISPKKTYAGMIGGYFLSLVCLILFISFIEKQNITIQFILLTLIISTVSQIGDITISYFKRRSKIKDTGKIIPGHGGLLDRIDGMIFAFPIVYLINITGYLNV